MMFYSVKCSSFSWLHKMPSKRVEAEIISSQNIKPSSETPQHLKCHKTSFLDQLAMQLYIPMMFFFESSEFSDHLSSFDILKNSLSETLRKYYTFSGRLAKDGLSIDCNDHGVLFLKAQIKCRLLDFLQDPDRETQSLLFPKGYFWKEKASGDCSLLGIQVNYFDCGGVGICMSISHKIADGCTINSFVHDWANTALDWANTTSSEKSPDATVMAPPTFVAKSILQLNLLNHSEIEIGVKENIVTKRYTFDGYKLAALKKSIGLDAASRVQIVTALLYKCAITVPLQSSLLIQTVNMRRRVCPPLPENSIGNFTWFHTISPSKSSINEFVVELQNGIRQFLDKNQKVNDWLLEIHESSKEVKTLFDDLDVYRFSSFCRWPFYEMNFGWGKPKWVSMGDSVVKNAFILFDTPDGDGIEAVVNLEEEHMKVFQQNEELLAFATTKH